MKQFVSHVWRRLLGHSDPAATPLPTLLVLEGVNDIQFMRRISRMLHASDRNVPDLQQWEQAGRVVMLPLGGNVLWPLAARLANLGCNEFHLYDREVSPVTEQRQQVVDWLNQKQKCRAVLTGKRSLENYLHPDAIQAACGVQVEVGDCDLVANLVAIEKFRISNPDSDWSQLPPRTRQKLRQRVKNQLNSQAVDHMTIERLAERDPAGEVRMWLSTIRELTVG